MRIIENSSSDEEDDESMNLFVVLYKQSKLLQLRYLFFMCPFCHHDFGTPMCLWFCFALPMLLKLFCTVQFY